MVEPTHLKNMLVKLERISRKHFGVEIPSVFELPPPSLFHQQFQGSLFFFKGRSLTFKGKPLDESIRKKMSEIQGQDRLVLKLNSVEVRITEFNIKSPKIWRISNIRFLDDRLDITSPVHVEKTPLSPTKINVSMMTTTRTCCLKVQHF